ncbi:MAG: hypothetical protein GY895_09010 [Phycisphaera sp.]|nr:hypothetical protein [Phycisphaera sp.]
MNETSAEDWPITRSELSGRYRWSRKAKYAIGVSVFLILIMGLVVLGGLAVLTRAIAGFDGLALIAGMTLSPFVMMVIMIVIQRRQRIKWEVLAERIWEADGCICPWCKVDVRSKPCEAHGVDSSHRDPLVAYYASPMLDNHARAYKRLVEAVPKPPTRTRLFAGPFGWIARQTQTIRNQDADPAVRKRTIINLLLTWYALLACIVTTVILVVPDGMKYIFASRYTGWMLLMMPLFFIFNPMSIGPAKCKACGQQCHEKDQEICSECGADLRKPGAVTRKEWSKRNAAKSVPIMIAIYTLPLMMGSIVDQLPTPARQAIWGTIGAPTAYFANLDPSTMTALRVEEEANFMLQLARPNGPGIEFSFDRGFIEQALDLGLLPESYREDAARATVSATIKLEETDGERQIVVVPRIDDSLLGNDGPRLAFGGISIDGGPWSPGASWTLVHQDLNEFWRNESTVLAPLPEDQLEFRVPVDLDPGPHEIQARCWILVEGPFWNRLDLTFDADGNPEFPAQAKVYDLPISTTVEVR